ncbi:MAG: CPBP family intramembrane glutamic endopeptidase [Bacteroidota bacterium]
MNPKLRGIFFSAFIIGIYFLIRNMAPLMRDSLGGEERVLRLIGYYGTYAIPVLLYMVIRFGFGQLFAELGLEKGFGKALGWALLFTLPMLIGYGIMGDLNSQLSAWSILLGAVCPALFEELVFRAFVFGQLFRHHSWGFVPAAAINAIVFGAAHLWQGNTIGESAGVFMITFSGAVWFAWLYVEWDFNLWVPIFMHFLMNLYWGMFTIADTALGGIWANVFRFLTIGLSIYMTIKMRKPISVNRSNLWWQKAG